MNLKQSLNDADFKYMPELDIFNSEQLPVDTEDRERLTEFDDLSDLELLVMVDILASS